MRQCVTGDQAVNKRNQVLGVLGRSGGAILNVRRCYGSKRHARSRGVSPVGVWRESVPVQGSGGRSEPGVLQYM